MIQASDWTDNALTFSVTFGSAPFNFGVNSGGFAFAEDSGNLGSALAVDTTHLLVFKVDDNGGNPDLWSFWVNPTSLSSEPIASATDTSSDNLIYTNNGDFASFSASASFNQNDILMFDELRVGETWADVVPVPESSNAGMIFGLGALSSILFFRRRKAN